MAKATIYCPDIECDSCVTFLHNTLKDLKGLKKYKVNKDTIEVDYSPGNIKPEAIAKFITEQGYRAGLSPFPRKTYKERWHDFRENKKKYEVEYTMLKYSIYVFIILIAVEMIAYFAFLRNDALFIQKYGIWIFYLDIAVVSIGAAMWHVLSYRGQVYMMSGMMLGMGFGMQTGLMIGTIIGATNGMFAGTMTGIIVAVFAGWYNGKNSGIMGVLEGAMAGIMNGAMGAMTAVMLYADNLMWYMPLFMALNIIIMWGMSYMMFEEVVENNPTIKKEPISFTKFLLYSLLAVAVIVTIMNYGPKSGLSGIYSTYGTV